MMQEYKFDMHVHTKETSSCGQVSAKELVRMYHDVGYQGIMITDHYHKSYFDSLGSIDTEEKVKRYLSGYYAAKEEGDKIGLDVILGIEFRNIESDDDFLIVGMTEEFLYQYPYMYELQLKEAIELFHKNDMLVIQAHPVRFAVMEKTNGKIGRKRTSNEMLELWKMHPEMTVLYQDEWKKIQMENRENEIRLPFILRVCELKCEDFLDGIEVYNGNIGWAQKPDEIKKILEKHPSYRKVSASDFHEKIHLARGGMIFNKRVKDSKELKELLLDDSMKAWIQH